MFLIHDAYQKKKNVSHACKVIIGKTIQSTVNDRATNKMITDYKFDYSSWILTQSGKGLGWDYGRFQVSPNVDKKRKKELLKKKEKKMTTES